MAETLAQVKQSRFLFDRTFTLSTLYSAQSLSHLLILYAYVPQITYSYTSVTSIVL